MPLPTKRSDETPDDFISRCMGDEVMVAEYGDAEQRMAVCRAQVELSADGPFDCECIECGHRMVSEQHCNDLACPTCGAQMRRAARPGPGRPALSAGIEGRISLYQGGGMGAPGLGVDTTAGIIRGVSVITTGEAVGWNFMVDEVMLGQVAAAINAAPGGVKVCLTHASMTDGADPIEFLIGRLRSATVEGSRVRADLHVGRYAAHSPRGDMRSYLLALAQDDPAAIGLSLVYDSVPGAANRLKTLYFVDLVGDPAANPTGLLSSGQGGPTMSKRLRSYLISCGMPAAYTDGEARVFLAKKLSRAQRAQVKALQEGSEAPADGEPEGAAGNADAPDLTPEEGEAEDAFVARFVGAADMQAKYPDGAERTRQAKEIYGAMQQPAEEANAATQEAEIAAAAGIVPVLSANIPASDRVKLEQQVLARDRERRQGIVALCSERGLTPEYTQGLCDRGVSLSQARELVELSKTMQPIPMGRTRVEVGDDKGRTSLAAGLRDAIMLRGGRQVEKPHPRARDFRGLTLLEMGRRWLASIGQSADGLSRIELASILLNRQRRVDRFGAVALAMGTSDFDAILRDAQGKTLLDAYRLATVTWPAWASRDTASDFKTQRRVRLSSAPSLLEKKEGAEYEFGAFQEGEETFVLATYGRELAFTREMMINDDLSAFSRVVPMMGRKAKYLEDLLAYSVLTTNAALSDGVDLFDAAHSNTGTGVINVANLESGWAAMGVQKDLDGSTLIECTPVSLIVPKAKEITAIEFVSSKVDPAKSNETPNPFNGRLQVVASPHLDATSAVAWYLSADPAMVDTVVVCFLEDEQEPVLEDDADFHTDDRHYKVRHNVKAAAVDYRGLYYSTGA